MVIDGTQTEAKLRVQPFSTSRSVKIDLQMGPQVPDIERNGYCFTDGVGFAGRAVLAEAAKALGYTWGINSRPSAIQFRLGYVCVIKLTFGLLAEVSSGAKGVLTDWPRLVGEHEIKLRPSLVKFASNLKDLNVVRVSSRSWNVLKLS